MSKHDTKQSTAPRTAAKPRQGGHGGFGPMGGGMAAGEKPKDFKGAMRKLLAYFGKEKSRMLLVSIMAIASAVFTIWGPKILGRAIDDLFSGMMLKLAGSGDIDFKKIGTTLLMLLGLYVISAVFSYLQGFIMSGSSARLTRALRNELNDKIHRLPLSYFDHNSHGDVISRITNDVDTINQSLNQSLTQIFTSITVLIGVIIMMLSISVTLTLVALFVIPLSMAAVILIIKKSQLHFANQQKYLGTVNGYVEEMYGNHVVVKAFSQEEQTSETFDEHNGKLYNAAWKSNFLSGLMMPITGFIGNLAYVAICIIGGSLAANGTMTIGGIQAFIQYVRSFNQPIAQVANLSNVLQQTAASAERVFEFLGEAEESPDAPDALEAAEDHQADSPRAIAVHGAVEFKHVSFGYNEDQIIIKDFSVAVKPGQKIAIVGPTGAGKTTIVKLLMRYYDVNAGAILLDGHDIREFKRKSLRSAFGMVLQDTWLFNGSIADNIRYGRLEASDEAVKEASKAAQVHHFVRTLPDGYNMVLNEEADNISQGQKQLLTIARAILADPEILILDEATSSVDTRTEVLIQKAMDNLMQGRTSFVIAHRLSTIRNADLILVLKDGDIVEQGTHADLLAQNGFYTSLHNSQFDTGSALSSTAQ